MRCQTKHRSALTPPLDTGELLSCAYYTRESSGVFLGLPLK